MNNLKKIRQARGETLEEVADAIGSSKQALWVVESGKHGISNKMLNALSSHFGVSADYILGIEHSNDSKSDVELLWESLSEEDQAFILKQMKILSSQKKDNYNRVADSQVLEDVNRKAK